MNDETSISEWKMIFKKYDGISTKKIIIFFVRFFYVISKIILYKLFEKQNLTLLMIRKNSQRKSWKENPVLFNADKFFHFDFVWYKKLFSSITRVLFHNVILKIILKKFLEKYNGTKFDLTFDTEEKFKSIEIHLILFVSFF